MRLFVPQPTADIYDFKGSLDCTFDSPESEVAATDLMNLQFIPRGSVIKNSGKTHCIVVYTGKETKLMQNLGNYNFKRSAMEKRVGTTFLINLLILVVFIIIASICNAVL